jgi:YHS domain-containing protein
LTCSGPNGSVDATITITVDSTAPSKPVVADGGVYTSSAATLQASWTGAVDSESGIAQYQYRITQDSTTGTVIKAWTSTGTTPSATATGLTLLQGKTYYFGVKAKNGVGLWSAVGYSNGIKVDTTAPIKPVVTDGGVYTNNSTTLNASWTGAVDSESGIAQYQYRITQDSTTGTVIKAWTSTGTTPSVTANGLTLLQGKTYYFGVIIVFHHFNFASINYFQIFYRQTYYEINYV